MQIREFVCCIYAIVAPALFALFLVAGCREAETVHFTIDAQRDHKPISPFIYGVNDPLDGYTDPPLIRTGGNRWTAYNWTHNASNAGNDWHFQNDGFLSNSNEPGAAVAARLRRPAAQNAAAIITVPINGYVAADKRGDGDVRASPDFLQTRFRISQPRKPAPFTLAPQPDDPIVYQDEFIHWLKVTFPDRVADPHRPIWFALDNEPDIWSGTHQAIHPGPVAYDELVARNTDYALAIKAVMPGTLIFAPVNYGWQGMVRLQNAPDAENRDFLEFYLDRLKRAEDATHQRLLDVLDVHWYPEATGGGQRITEQAATDAIAEARIQAPRSLWDPTYVEQSWITAHSLHGPITLLPRLQKKIDQYYPGTKLALTEYNYGGGAHISGAIAQADVLGLFGTHGLFAACEWPLARREPFIAAGFLMYRNFDGRGARFGDTSVYAVTDHPQASSIYASTDSAHPAQLVLVAINKTPRPISAGIRLLHAAAFTRADIFCLTVAAPAPAPAAQLPLTARDRFTLQMPPMSVCTVRLSDNASR